MASSRTTAHEEKRQLLLDAAVRVFARKGFHAARVGDVATEAGVAYGLVYHYFGSKDDLLECIFRENWAVMLDRIRTVEESDEPARAKLRHVTAIVLRSWKHNPELVRVLVREVTRTPHLQRQMEEIGHAFQALQRIIERGQAAGELRGDIDPHLASVVFYGALEELLTAWVLGRLPDDEEAVAEAERTVVELLARSLAKFD